MKPDIYLVASKYTNLKSRGNGLYYGLCPIHHEDTPSFHVNANLGVFYCFGCGNGGNVFQLISLLEKVPISQVDNILYEKFGIDIGNKKAKKMDEEEQKNNETLEEFRTLLKKFSDDDFAKEFNRNKLGLDVPYECFYVSPSKKLDLIKEVKKNLDIERLVSLGIFKKENEEYKFLFTDRIIFPVYSQNNRLVGFIGRAYRTNMAPKYLMSRFKKNEILMFLNLAVEVSKNTGSSSIYVVEGVYDAIALLLRNIPAVAILGTHLSIEHVNILNRFSVVNFLLDNDEAGINSYFSISKTLIQTNRSSFSSNFVFYQSDKQKDIDEILQEISFDDFIKTVKTKSVYDVFIDFHLKNIMKDFPSGVDKSVIREELFKRFMKLFKSYRENEHAYNLMIRVCERSKYPLETLIKRVDAIVKKENSNFMREMFLLNKEYITPKERNIVKGVVFYLEKMPEKLFSMRDRLLKYPFKSKIAKALVEFYLEERSEISEEEYSFLVELEPEEVNLEELLTENREKKYSDRLANIARKLGLYNVERIFEEKSVEGEKGDDDGSGKGESGKFFA